MDELKNTVVWQLVKKLEDTDDPEARIRILQEINRTILTEYVVQIGDYIIEPLLVESYYYDKNTFQDTSVHAACTSEAPTYSLARGRQTNHFGELYVHYGCKDGIDVVLSDGDYAFSILIKNAFVNGQFKKQCAISDAICSGCDHACNKGQDCKYHGSPVLKKEPEKTRDIVFLKRKNVKGEFAEKETAALPIDEIRNHPFTPGESATTLVTRYIEKQLQNGCADKAKLQELAKGLIAWSNFES